MAFILKVAIELLRISELFNVIFNALSLLFPHFIFFPDVSLVSDICSKLSVRDKSFFGEFIGLRLLCIDGVKWFNIFWETGDTDKLCGDDIDIAEFGEFVLCGVILTDDDDDDVGDWLINEDKPKLLLPVFDDKFVGDNRKLEPFKRELDVDGVIGVCELIPILVMARFDGVKLNGGVK